MKKVGITNEVEIDRIIEIINKVIFIDNHFDLHRFVCSLSENELKNVKPLLNEIIANIEKSKSNTKDKEEILKIIEKTRDNYKNMYITIPKKLKISKNEKLI